MNSGRKYGLDLQSWASRELAAADHIADQHPDLAQTIRDQVEEMQRLDFTIRAQQAQRVRGAMRREMPYAPS